MSAASGVTTGATSGATSGAAAGWVGWWRALCASPLAVAGAAILLAFVLAALLAPWIAPYDPAANDLINMLAPPDWAHPLGTDQLGRDVFSRVLYGGRLSLLEGVLSVALSMAVGVPLGLLSGYVGGWTDLVMMRLIDILLAFPGVLLAIAIVSVLGADLTNAMLAIAVYSLPIFVRLTRGATLAAKNELYVEACRAVGMGHLRILLRHVLPNMAPILTIVATLRVAAAILTASSLSFLGLGAQPPSPEWGAMLADGRNTILIAPAAMLFPGVAIVLVVLGLNFLQEGLRGVLDPKAR